MGRKLAVVVAFALFLGAPALAWLAGLRGRVVENRPPVGRPAFAVTRLLDASYYAELTGWLRDALPLRAEAIAFDSWLDFRLLGDSPSMEVLIGVSGELFHAESLRTACRPGVEPVQLLRSLRRLADTLAPAGIELYLLLSPAKHALYPELLPRGAEAHAACASEEQSRLREALARGGAFHVVDLWSRFAPLVARGERLYPRLGTHWEDRTGLLQTRALVEAIAPGLWNDGLVVGGEPALRSGELTRRYMNLEVLETRPRHQLVRPGVEVTGVRFRLAEGAKGWVTQRTAQSSGPALIPGHTLVIADSFMDQSTESLAAFCERLTVVHWVEALERPDAAARLVARADRVVLQATETRRARLHPQRLEPLRRAVAQRLRRAAAGPDPAGPGQPAAGISKTTSIASSWTGGPQRAR